MKIHSRTIFSLCILLTLLLSLPVINGCGPSRLRSEARQAAETLLSSVSVPTTSMVVFVGPVEPGTIIREPPGEGRQPVELHVPDTTGTYYAFSIDDAPNTKYMHPMRYAYVNLDTGEVNSVNASYPMAIYRPNRERTPFEMISLEEIEGVMFFFLKGDGGAAGSVDISHKPEAELSLLEEDTSIALRAQEWQACPEYAITASVEQRTTTGAGEMVYISHEPEIEMSSPVEEALGVPELQGTRPCQKHEIVFDGATALVPWLSHPRNSEYW